MSTIHSLRLHTGYTADAAGAVHTDTALFTIRTDDGDITAIES